MNPSLVKNIERGFPDNIRIGLWCTDDTSNPMRTQLNGSYAIVIDGELGWERFKEIIDNAFKEKKFNDILRIDGPGGRVIIRY